MWPGHKQTVTACASVCVLVRCSLTLSTCLSNELALQQNVRHDRAGNFKRKETCSACARCEEAVVNVADALEMKGLSLSPEKTVAMFITHRSTTDIPAVTCNGTPIKTVTQARLLGVIVDDQLSWREHVNHLYRKIARKIGALRRSSRQLTPTARRQFFISVIRGRWKKNCTNSHKKRKGGGSRDASHCARSASDLEPGLLPREAPRRVVVFIAERGKKALLDVAL